MKTLIGVGSVIGCCAVGIPLGIYSANKLKLNSSETSKGDASTQLTSVNVERCKEGEGVSAPFLNFGDKTSNSICWNFQPPGGKSENLSYETKISDFFKLVWDKGVSAWSGINNSPWKAACFKNTENRWIISQPSGGEYLGLCEEESLENSNAIFLHKQTESEKVKQIKLCQQDCWDYNDQSTSDSWKTYQNWKSENWKEIMFFKK